MPYRLPDGYRRQTPAPFDDHAAVGGHTAGWVWQPDVYPHAAALARALGVSTLIDVGCGAARKLLPYADEFSLVGVDRPEIVEHIDGDGDWFPVDLDAPGGAPLDCSDSLVICSDVIEHMVHPEHLANRLKAMLETGAAAVVLSTPDRERTVDRTPTGPSPNPHHAQEWALDELVDWLQDDIGFHVAHAGWTRSNDHEPDLATCLLELALPEPAP